ncbi:MAG TPA: uracil-DNA glycosylase [Actinomycetota bacterium]|nr:uracil-DNA glycosylase [Actinomycetota bacterium]
MSGSDPLTALMDEITSCFACPRLVEWRERVATEKRAAFATETYWGRPVPSFGDPEARVLVLGLAPAAHGGNRTGRIFTGDRSGDFLFASMHRTGFANQPTSVSRHDGLRLSDAWIAAPVRCAPPANKPTPAERDACFPFLLRELALLERVSVTIALGGFAWDSALRAVEAMDAAKLRPKPRFAHSAEVDVGRFTLLGSYHVSQQNTFTGRLTPDMLDNIFERARELAEG